MVVFRRRQTGVRACVWNINAQHLNDCSGGGRGAVRGAGVKVRLTDELASAAESERDGKRQLKETAAMADTQWSD